MISTEVQRTLVKSQPELWAELSDPAALARHLGELGEIRITRTEPEQTVEWEAENVTGTVTIEASGWGTKVTLSVTRELPAESGEAQVEPVAAAPDAPVPARRSIGAEIEMTVAERFAAHDFEPLLGARDRFAGDDAPEEPAPGDAGAPAASAPDATPQAPQATETRPTRRGLFARLFGHRSRASMTPPERGTPVAEPPALERPASEQVAADAVPVEDTAAVGSSVADIAPVDPPGAATAPLQSPAEPAPQADAGTDEEQADLAAELRAAEEHVEAVLTAVLDKLGAAHHRPFSRA